VEVVELLIPVFFTVRIVSAKKFLPFFFDSSKTNGSLPWAKRRISEEFRTYITKRSIRKRPYRTGSSRTKSRSLMVNLEP
jgi:hypothetical protein